MTDHPAIPDEAVKAGAVYLWGKPVGDATEMAYGLLAAALPHIEPAIRAKIVAEAAEGRGPAAARLLKWLGRGDPLSGVYGQYSGMGNDGWGNDEAAIDNWYKLHLLNLADQAEAGEQP